MTPLVWWYLARASGLVAWALLSASVVSGLLVRGRLTGGRPRPAWTTDLHRFLAGAGVVLVALHLTGLVADDVVHFGALQILVPFTSSWRPAAVTLGVLALYLLVAVEGTSLLMRHLPRRWWRSVHLSSYGLFWATTFHLWFAGTDATTPLVHWAVVAVMGLVVFLTLLRIFLAPPRGRAAVTPKEKAPSWS